MMGEQTRVEEMGTILLAFARELHRAMRLQERREWIHQSRHEHLFELADKTMLLIGLGAIGERTARVAAAMDMRVLGVRRDSSLGAPGVEAMSGPHRLHDLLPQADVVVLTVPRTAETRGIIGEPDG